MAVRLPKGAKEYVGVLVDDSTDVVTTLDGTSPNFDVVRESNSTYVYTAQSAINAGMLIQCLIDTSLSGFVTGERYFLYVRFTLAPEIPEFGPFDIWIT
jgi:hypothetical protein